MFISYQLVDLIAELNWWKIDRWFWREVLALLMCFVVLGSLVGSTRLNLQILRQANAKVSLPTRTMPQFLFLILSIAMLYFTLRLESFITFTYDSHLSSHYMNITLPRWPWLMTMTVFIGDPGFTVQNFDILFFLLLPFAPTLFIALYNTGFFSAVARHQQNAISSALLNWHVTLGAILVLFSLFFFFDLFHAGRSFVFELGKDPALLNSSNLASLAIGLIFFLLLLAYGQWIFRDGVILRRQ